MFVYFFLSTGPLELRETFYRFANYEASSSCASIDILILQVVAFGGLSGLISWILMDAKRKGWREFFTSLDGILRCL